MQRKYNDAAFEEFIKHAHTTKIKLIHPKVQKQ
jgi:hypothetical protein